MSLSVRSSGAGVSHVMEDLLGMSGEKEDLLGVSHVKEDLLGVSGEKEDRWVKGGLGGRMRAAPG